MGNQLTARIDARIQYRYDDSGECGREWVTLTAERDGSRTVRALCELDDVKLQRDATISYDPSWNATDGYIHMRRDDQFLGVGWFHFSATEITCEAMTAAEGRVSQAVRPDGPIGVFAPHPVFLDPWHATRHDPRGPEVQELRNCVTSSPLWHGGSGPLIYLQHRRIRRLPDAEVTVPAGSFSCEAYQLLPSNPLLPPIEFWVYGIHKCFVRLRWDHLKATYELVEYAAR